MRKKKPFLAIINALLPVIEKYVVPAIQIVIQVKRLLKASDTPEKLRDYLKAIFKDDAKVDRAIDKIAKALDHIEGIELCLEKKTPLEKIGCLLVQVRAMRKREQRVIWRELVKSMVMADKPGIEDSRMNLAIELAYAAER